MKKLLAASVLIAFSSSLFAHSLDKDCNPKGWRGNLAFFDQQSFWSGQIKEIAEFVAAKKKAYQLAVIEHNRNLADINFGEQESRVMGISPDAEDSRFARKMSADILADEYQDLVRAVEWSKRCTAHANYMLINAK